MSNVPPPHFGPPSGPPGQPLPYISPPPPTADDRRPRWLVAGAVAAVLAIAGAALYIVTKDDEAGNATGVTTVSDTATASTDVDATVATAPATEPTEPAVTTTVPDTVAPDTTDPSGDSTTTTTDEASTTTAVTLPRIPAGAADLGNGVYLPVPDGWTQGTAGSMVQLTGNDAVVIAQTMVRPPGTDPALLTQEYVNAFDSAFETVSYGPTQKVKTVEGALPADIYATYFVTFDSSSGVIESGFFNMYVRGDGLALVYSVYGPNGGVAFPSDAGETMNESFTAAPPVGNVVTLAEAPPFRVATAHTDVVVAGLVAFTAAPGFTLISEGDGLGFVTNNTVEDVQVNRLTSQADTNAVTASAQAVLAANYTGLEYTDLVLEDPDVYGIFHGTFTWTGTFVGGQLSKGVVDFWFDPASTNAFVAFRTWFSVGEGGEPFYAASQFMLRSLSNSFTTIP